MDGPATRQAFSSTRPWLLVGLWLVLTTAARAGTYGFASDSYAWESTTQTLNWDRSCTAYPNDDDKATITFSGGFRFPFAGTTHASVRVHTNGILQFGTDTGLHRAYNHTSLPTGAAPARSGCTAGATTLAMFVHWTDLNPSAGGSVTWQQKGIAPNRYLVVSWNDVPRYNSSTRYTFQAILYENGEFKYQFGTSASGAVATIGVQVSAADFTQVAFNNAAQASGSAIRWREVPPMPHHLEIAAPSSTGVTCAPFAFTIRACADAACAAPYTGGLTGQFALGGAGVNVVYPGGSAFTIAAGSDSTTVAAQMVTPGTAAASVSGLSVTPTATPAVYCGMGVAPAAGHACTVTAADSGFVFDVPHHVAESLQTVRVAAVRKVDGASVCAPSFVSTARSLTFRCGYTNPSSGTRAVRVGGRALNAGNNAASACDGTGQAVSLAFDAVGVATTTVQYADVGQLSLSAQYTGSGADAGLAMSGSDSFVTAPAEFQFSGISVAPLRAGQDFGATLTARNSAGVATPNFGRESIPATATIAFVRRQPAGSAASDGIFTGSHGSFSAGTATASNLNWSEVGRGDLTATLAGGSYLGSGLTASGSTGTGGAVGPFVPHHFDVSVTPACGSFTYSAQPFAVRITARNGLATPTTTVNYDGSAATTPNFARSVALSDAAAVPSGGFGSTGTVLASAFQAGVATHGAAAYTFASKTTAPQSVIVRATDSDGVSSSGHTEGTLDLRSGWLRLVSAFGSERSALQLPVQAQYWSGQAWVPNAADNCTTVPAAAVARSGYLDHRGAPTAAWTTTASAVAINAGTGVLTLSAPTPAASGSVDIALNLGPGGTDQSCLSAHPATAGANLPWLRARNGACATTWDRDPAARASFGIASPESRRTVHARELF